jgi:hypothetical protein
MYEGRCTLGTSVTVTDTYDPSVSLFGGSVFGRVNETAIITPGGEGRGGGEGGEVQTQRELAQKRSKEDLDEFIKCMRDAQQKYEQRLAKVWNVKQYAKDAFLYGLGGSVTEKIKSGALGWRYALAFAAGRTVINVGSDFFEDQDARRDSYREQNACEDNYDRKRGMNVLHHGMKWRTKRTYPNWR